MSEAEKNGREKREARSLATAAGMQGVLGSSCLRFQFAEKCEPTVLVNDTFICEIVRDEVFTRGIGNNLQKPLASVTTTYRAPSLTKNCCTSSNGELIRMVSGAWVIVLSQPFFFFKSKEFFRERHVPYPCTR
jgi:hypothetical protein